MGHMNDLFAAPDAAQDVHHHVTLASATDLATFRSAARTLLSKGVLPAEVMWHVALQGTRTAPDLFHADPVAAKADACSNPGGGCSGEATGTVMGDVTDHVTGSARSASAITVPQDFITLCENVVLHSDPCRFGLLYRLLWRLTHEPGLRHDPLDADRMLAAHLAQAVRRDVHKMKAFVRFRTVQDDSFRSHPQGGPLHVAWFEPEHHIVEAVAPFFARRFTQMRWAVLTPERCMAWNGASVVFSPGAKKSDAPPADAGEALWLTYYQHIFNPARLKLKAMHKEMPCRYWHNLPEAQFISTLSASASTRQARMIEQPHSMPNRRIPAFKTPQLAPAAAQQVLQI